MSTGWAEVYRSERTLVERGASPARDGAVIRTIRSGPDGRRRVAHEAAILELLRGVPGVPRLVSPPTGAELLVDDVGGVSLADLVAADRSQTGTPWRFTELLHLATSLTSVIAEVHRRGVVHRDISPANVVVHGPERQPVLIDFELAVTSSGAWQPAGPGDEIAGTLAYLAPEQSGRTGRTVDQRTDLYSLGATLYELACGRPPFGRGDDGGALDLIHDHLARRPTSLALLCPDLPEPFCTLVSRLLEKEQDRRYQSADGLLHDLRLIRAQLDQPSRPSAPAAPMRLGTRDFPLRFTAPAQPVARERASDVQAATFAAAVQGTASALLVHGPAGVGKTALTEQLRPLVARCGGRMVSTETDDGHGLDAGLQAVRAVARMLLTQSESALLTDRGRLLDALGDSSGLLSGVLPEVATLLAVAPEAATGDPAQVQAALVQAALAVLRTVATPGRPLVVVLDGLHAASPFCLDLLDAVVSGRSAAGLLVVGTYRDDELTPTHPLAALTTRWERLRTTPERISLTDLAPDEVADLLAEILRIDADSATELAAPVHLHAGGNPYDTIELLNALRRDALLAPGPDGWLWDPAAVHRYAGDFQRADLLTARVVGLPARTRDVLSALACLGGRVDLPLLAAATALAPDDLRRDLGPALAEGLVVGAPSGEPRGGDGLHLPNDRVRRAVLDQLDESGARALHLRIGRRLRDRPGYRVTAAEAYLQGVDDVTEAAERCSVVGVLADAAAALRVTSPAAAERCLGAAVGLLDGLDADEPGWTPGPASGGSACPSRLALTVARHAALYSLGRYEEADALYATLQVGPGAAPDLFAAGAVQVAALTNRARPLEAVDLGLHLLRALGLAVPDADALPAIVARGLQELYTWADEDAAAADHGRPEVTDPMVLAAAEIISVVMPPAFFSNPDVTAWLVLESRRLWAAHGPCRALVAPLCHAAVVTIDRRQDFAVGYRVVRRVLNESVLRHYEPETSRARFLFAVSAAHWFEPLETVLDEARLAREGLLAGGDAQGAVFTYHATTPAHLDLAGSLDEYEATVDAGLHLAALTGNDQTVAAALPYRDLVHALRRSGTDDSGADDSGTDDSGTDDGPATSGEAGTNPMAAVNGHLARGLAAAILGHRPALRRHARAAVPLLPFVCGHYAMSRVHLLRALAAADELDEHAQDGPGRAAALVALQESHSWLAARAHDSPASFAHLLSLVDAERAAASGDVPAARLAFDRALRLVSQVARPWHRAHVLERAGLFALRNGEEFMGSLLLEQSLGAYAAWGATAKVDQLRRRHTFLDRSGPGVPAAHGRSTMAGITTDALDLISVLKASQALSRETALDELRVRVVDVLVSMTGATSVTVLLKDDDGRWEVPATGEPGGPELAELVPLSVVRYAERTREPVVVADTATDQRFCGDPYLAGAGSGSLLVIPILSDGDARVMLVLENGLQRSVFSADRLDAVMLVAGQLTVSFNIALARRQLELENVRRVALLDQLRSREQLLETLLSIQRDISHRAPLQTVLDAVTAGASRLFGGDYVALVLADPATGSVPVVPSVSGASSGPALDAAVLSIAIRSIAADALVSLHGPSSDGDPRDHAADGESSLHAAPVHVSGEIIGSLVTLIADGGTGLTERQDLLAAFAEQVSLALNDATTLQAIRAASLDPLTGLATRRSFLERLDAALRLHSGQVGVLFIDLDRFKQVNDSLGHDAGDQLLAGVAERLLACIRETDTAARLGGDEFAILLEGGQGAGAGERVGEALTAALQQPFRIAGKEIFATASIGVAVGGGADATASELLQQADLAMYRAKRERSRRPVVFEPRMHEDVSKRLDLQSDLERAVAAGQLWLQYQPQVRLDDGRVTGVEALVRWTHPVRGPISPAEFVPIAEDTGVIVDLGRWVLREACRQVALWRRDVHPSLTVSVNVSGRQLAPALVCDVLDVLAQTGLDPSALTLELTESVLLEDPASSLARLEELKALGVLLALDDFGTGYSSLSHLHRFRVDELKIDKSFIDKITDSDADLAIVRAVLELARVLDLRTIAEGVETEDQRDLLAGLGCTEAQGYLFARPMSAPDVPGFLVRHLLPRQLQQPSIPATAAGRPVGQR